MITDYYCVKCGDQAIVVEQKQYYCPKCWFKLFTKVYDNDKIKDREFGVEAQTKVLQGRAGR